MNKIRLAVASAILAVAITPLAASAAKPVTFVLAVECSDGNTYELNFGAPKNQGTALFLVGDNGILTSNYFLLTIDGQVVIDSVRGLNGLESQDLVTCVGSFDSGGQVWEYTITGFVTPRG